MKPCRRGRVVLPAANCGYTRCGVELAAKSPYLSADGHGKRALLQRHV